ncbi:MAG: zf-TFIIB domain-containing protein [Deltaproteobacteria bacterium]|nr:zf-TFIIB domain-containing protein [Deltaproteobacteria bacterium]
MTFRDGFPMCPTCRSPLDARGRRFVCEPCTAVLVTSDELGELLRELRPNDTRALEQQLKPLGPGPRPCPRCPVVMESVKLGDVPLDRCAAHGIWFDHDELERVLGGGRAAVSAFEVEHQNRVDAADSFELGELGMLLKALWPWKKQRR